MANGNISDREYYSFRDKPSNIYELQQFLRYISQNTDGIPTVVPDGIYGPETRAAVSAFQKKTGLSQGGEADFETWIAIVNFYDELKRKNLFPKGILGYPPEIPHLKEGDDFEEIYLLQIMLRRIAKIFKNVTMPDLTGVYDSKTSQAVKDFSRLYGRENRGIVDRELWNILTDTYNAFTING